MFENRPAIIKTNSTFKRKKRTTVLELIVIDENKTTF